MSTAVYGGPPPSEVIVPPGPFASLINTIEILHTGVRMCPSCIEPAPCRTLLAAEQAKAARP